MPKEWIEKTWDELSDNDRLEIQALSNGSIPFKYLGAYYLFKDAVFEGEKLDVNTRIHKLGALETDAGHDFWRATQWYLLRNNLIDQNEWQEFFIAIALNNLPYSQSLAFKPIELSRDSSTWPIGYKDTLYNMTGIPTEAPLLDVLRVLVQEVKTTEIADLYLSEFITHNLETSALSSEEIIAEINRVATIVPAAKRTLVTAVVTLPVRGAGDNSNEKLTLGYYTKTPAERLQTLRTLSDEGVTEATNHLAEAYAGALRYNNCWISLAEYLGLSTLASLPKEERTFGTLNHMHQERTIDLIRLGLKGNRLAQHLLFKKDIGDSFSIVEKLFDNRMAQGNTPCQEDQRNMNHMLTQCLRFGFSITNILNSEHTVPEDFSITRGL